LIDGRYERQHRHAPPRHPRRAVLAAMSTMHAVVLAGGLGKRMRAPDPGAALTPDQQRAADAGLKGMIPLNGRPFLDYILSSLADAGIRDVALVVSPDHEGVSRYYRETAPPSRVRVSFVVQQEPLGTANAVLAAEGWTAREPFLAMNGDNLYPIDALADLAALDEPGLPAFERDDLVRFGNIPPERIAAFAVVEVDGRGYLSGIVEKPGEAVLARDGGAHAIAAQGHSTPQPLATSASGPAQRAGNDRVLISMNCWRFDARIYDACRAVPRSARGEFELPEAVGLAMRGGVTFKALRARGQVLDLSRRADMADVATRLTGIVPRP
jgi:dTDP-glucose pyrophosphorylase